jgi:hypothetical protein
MRVIYDLNKDTAACAAAQIIPEHIISIKAYFRQCASVAGLSVTVRPSRNFMSRNLTIIMAATTHQKIISEVRVEPLSPMIILAVHIISIKLPNNIQKGLAKIANIPLCLSIGWLVGADIIRLLKKSSNLIYLGGGPTTPNCLWD